MEGQIAYERHWAAVQPTAFTADGTTGGLVTVADTAGFRVKQAAYLENASLGKIPVQIKLVLSPTTLIVGKCDNKIANWPPLDISAWTVALGTLIGAERQDKSGITPEDILRAIYEGDPAAAIRSLNVDQYGTPISAANPLPVNADVTVNSVQLFTKPYDSIVASYPSPTQEVYQTKLGGISGTLQETVTVNYVDSSKNQLVNVIRT